MTLRQKRFAAIAVSSCGTTGTIMDDVLFSPPIIEVAVQSGLRENPTVKHAINQYRTFDMCVGTCTCTL